MSKKSEDCDGTNIGHGWIGPPIGQDIKQKQKSPPHQEDPTFEGEDPLGDGWRRD